MLQLMEINGSWIIQTENIEVANINIGLSFDLFCKESDDIYLWISLDDFQIRSKDNELLQCKMEHDKHQRALELIHQKFESVTFSEQGRLEIFFSNGMNIYVPDDPDTAWRITTPMLNITKHYNHFVEFFRFQTSAE